MMNFEELKKVGEGEIECLVISLEEKKGGKDGVYTSVTLSDGNEKVGVNLWKKPEAFQPLVGKVVKGRFETNVKDGKTFINAKDSRLIEVPGGDINKYLLWEPIDVNQCMGIIYKYVDSITDPDLRAVTRDLLDSNAETYMRMAGGRAVHHDRFGGLIYHNYRMLATAKSLIGPYNLDYNLMIAGTVLHDIGKVKEMETDQFGSTNYTLDGNLFGHLYMGACMVDESCRKLGIDPEKQVIKLLKHIIISHHGKLEHDAIKVPAFKEAYAIHMVDDLDAKMYQYDKYEAEVPEGEISDKAYTYVDNAHIYHWRVANQDA